LDEPETALQIVKCG